MIYGKHALCRLLALPLRRPGVKVHYEGSIDKCDENSDWDWFMYQDKDRNLLHRNSSAVRFGF